MKQTFYICHHCGNITALIRDKGVPLFCCGEKMHEMVPGTSEASEEKHIPVYEIQHNTVCVSVGAAAHPMSREHYIEWICLETEHTVQYAHLDPDAKPKAKFALCEGDQVRAVWAFCNQHSLWRN